ncbi:MAG: hypothetical protein E3J56_15875 [Candidatus Aminicenantes bacterium]|nr:MAG: hypothetical protein E3J56_15875 [Candidatus Aminicenantes bacterium]
MQSLCHPIFLKENFTGTKMRNLILEFGNPQFKIIEEKKDKKGEKWVKAEAVWQRADTINSNRRLYPRKVLEKEIDRLDENLKAGQVVGLSHHPPDAHGKVNDVSHIWESISIEKDGTCRGKLTVIPTESGKNIIELIKAGVRIPLSSRGVGTLTKKEKKVDGKVVEYDEVNDDFKLLSPGDFVLSASVEGAGLTELTENGQKQQYILTESDKSVLKSFNGKDDDKEVMTEKEFDETVEAYLHANFRTSDHYRSDQFDEFKRNNEAKYRKLLAEQFQKEGLVLSKEITAEKKKPVKFELGAGLTNRDFDICGASFEERENYKKSLNERNKEAVLKSNATEREQQLYKEARRAGVNLSFEEWKKKYSKVEPARVSTKQITEDEKKKRKIQEQNKWNLLAGKSK